MGIHADLGLSKAEKLDQTLGRQSLGTMDVAR